MPNPAGVGRSHRDGQAEPPAGPNERRAAILEMVMAAGSVKIEDLPDAFGVSLMTVHRDLDTLATQGLIRKTRGVATAMPSTLSEASTEFRARQNVADKHAVANAALQMIEPGQSVIIDDSTTGLHLVSQLPERQPLTVITNFQSALDALLNQPGLNVIALGGQYYPWCRAYMGSLTLTALRNIRADVFIMSTSAVTDGICFHQHHDTVLVKRAMFESARTRIAYLDHSKFERRALHALGPLSDFDTVIVDSRTPEDQIRALRLDGVNVVVAPDIGASAL
ncbi:DeoR/GlpR family DNA-binding transcription regulator [Mycolicibacterium brisbanense]|uniref:DeoR family transcriptional regulator n=1 Tax=Mycolicibacterium brisbanense TaxID=146020 RepID=A0A100W253_9MYCO|nr:DeoR/GlpR family DNA-binding transcription regulator [Mycolicibacterium brisbanense]MCV7157591.1 DeoR/GlpR transcriptional regulator [Mycolicibacterium brisbanense]GAS90232.1 DeoR family transcriptional regulator [Mycolicibacterium brisbanense]